MAWWNHQRKLKSPYNPLRVFATGELDKRNLKLIDLVDYNTRFDEQYLSTLISKVGNKFSGIDVDNWINEIRGKA